MKPFLFAVAALFIATPVLADPVQDARDEAQAWHDACQFKLQNCVNIAVQLEQWQVEADNLVATASCDIGPAPVFLPDINSIYSDVQAIEQGDLQDGLNLVTQGDVLRAGGDDAGAILKYVDAKAKFQSANTDAITAQQSANAKFNSANAVMVALRAAWAACGKNGGPGL